MTDILERLKTSTKINGAHPRDISDAIKEIEKSRQEIAGLLASVEELREMYRTERIERIWFEDQCERLREREE